MSFMLFLFFNGNCEEVMDFYVEVFGVDEVVKMFFVEVLFEVGMLFDVWVMYFYICIGEYMLMVFDILSG